MISAARNGAFKLQVNRFATGNTTSPINEGIEIIIS